jgi:ribonuclease BN (tRNA processing enzyme)
MMIPELGIVLDAGTAMYRVRDLIETSTLDIFLTHAHLDHVIGVTFLFDVLWEMEMEHVRVHAEPDKVAALKAHLFSKLIFPVQPPFDWAQLIQLSNETQSQTMSIGGGGTLTYFRLKHPGGALGYRLDWPGRSLAYVTDTTAVEDADYIEQIRGVDVLLHECYFPDGWEDRAELTGHSCISPVAKVAAAADVGRLILVHINPLAMEDDPFGLDRAREIFANIEIGTDGQVVDF